MYAIANTTISIFRATTVDEYEDVVSAGVPSYTAVLASIHEWSHKQFNPTTGHSSVIRDIDILVGSGTDLQEGDIILDESTGTKYTISGITSRTNIGMLSDLQGDLLEIGDY